MAKAISDNKEITLLSENKWGKKFTYKFKEKITSLSQSTVMIHCDKHGYFEMNLRKHFASKYGCKKCALDARRKKISSCDTFIKDALKIHGNLYNYNKVKYTNGKKNVLIYCKKHKMDFLQTPAKHLNGQGCPKCGQELRARNRLLDQQEYILNCKSQYKKDAFDYSMVNYKGGKKDIRLKCNKCDNIFDVSAYRHQHHGQGCPKCSSSKGERLIAKYLQELNIDYEQEYKFPDLYSQRELRYDFYIKSKNILIEYDGLQHFEPVRFGGIDLIKAEKAFIKCKEHDLIKDNYAKEKGMKLIRIRYFDEISLKILEKRLL